MNGTQVCRLLASCLAPTLLLSASCLPHKNRLPYMPNKRRSPSDWTLTTRSAEPFGSRLTERAEAFGKLDAG
jgi:hypothetical protein